MTTTGRVTITDNKQTKTITKKKTDNESLCRNWIIDPYVQLHTYISYVTQILYTSHSHSDRVIACKFLLMQQLTKVTSNQSIIMSLQPG